MEGKSFTQVLDFTIEPPTEDKVWRYTSLGALLTIIARNQLFFCRADKFNDIHEGVTPSSIDPERDMEFQKRVFISCWNKSEHESYALWKAYANSNEGVAIQSTISHLWNSISAGFTPREVIYLDRTQDKIDVAAWTYNFLQKDRTWQDEKEYRLIITDPKQQYQYERFGYEFVPDKNEAIGMYVRVNPQSLIQKIVTSPSAAPWFCEVIQTIVNDKFHLSIPVEPSALSGIIR